MPNTEKRPKKVTPPREMIGFTWGGTTQEWEEEADQVMHILQDQLDRQESDEELQNKINYIRRKR
ncbi:MAG: hypothetical protein ACOX0L_04215 [Natronincolaceae bacterium]|jgi:hypothetical protein|nr:hypothetical protein [Bacillota bacterium]NLK90236.1 hypothetical protein [Clostridiales bacterium]